MGKGRGMKPGKGRQRLARGGYPPVAENKPKATRDKSLERKNSAMKSCVSIKRMEREFSPPKKYPARVKKR